MGDIIEEIRIQLQPAAPAPQTLILDNGAHVTLLIDITFGNGGSIVNGLTGTVVHFAAGQQIPGPVELFFDGNDIFHADPIQVAGAVEDAVI